MPRQFELTVSVAAAAAGKWSSIEGPICLEASSLDELCLALHAALLGLGRADPTSASVAIEAVFDADEERITTLRAELAALRLKALIRRAEELGVDEDDLEEVEPIKMMGMLSIAIITSR